MDKFDYKKIEKIIHYSFKNKEILKTAFTHSSYANNENVASSERLEFLGDAILDFVIADSLFRLGVNEGSMSKWRGKMVSGDTLSSIVSNENLDRFLIVGASLAKKRIPSSVKEALFESIVGAIYIDSSLEKAKRFILRFINVKDSIREQDSDYKTILQERVQKRKGANLVYFTYEVPESEGDFCAEAYINDIFVSRGFGKNKKQAQKECAKLALENDKILSDILK